MTNGSADPIEYDERSDEAWAAAVGSTFTWEDSDGTWVLTGSCPRCGHEMDKAFPSETWLTEEARGGTRRVVVACNCTQEHSGRPAGREGCGAYGGLELAGE